jgi:arsenite methyltransferase
MKDVRDDVKDYYGNVLKSSEDLMTNACQTSAPPPRYIKTALSKIHEEVLAKYYGCGLVLPMGLEGARVLDLGSGAGRDCYIASQLVGPEGFVAGVDMTKEQLLTARKHIDFHMKEFGYSKNNVEFHEGYLEELTKLNLKAGSFDVVVSNCVLNLVKDKQAVLDACFHLLKEGGEMYFSDVYSSRRIPEVLSQDKVLYGECLSGALYWNDFEHMAKKSGFMDPRVVVTSPITIQNEDASEKLGDIKFHSITYRLFKLKDLEPDCEDYGQAVKYRGNIPHSEKGMFLDAHHYFEKGKIMPVCGNTWNMLQQTRFKESFEFYGNFETHYGIFDGCGKTPPFGGPALGASTAVEGASCC